MQVTDIEIIDTTPNESRNIYVVKIAPNTYVDVMYNFNSGLIYVMDGDKGMHVYKASNNDKQYIGFCYNEKIIVDFVRDFVKAN